ncbi:hypothetical protein D3C81_1501370 [compost metagenome]
MNTQNMPAKPIEPIARASHTWVWLNARSSRIGEVRISLGSGRRWRATISTVARASRLTSANAVRQVNCWPIQVVSGLPTRMAIDRPSSTLETAAPRCSGGLIDAATSMATPK